MHKTDGQLVDRTLALWQRRTSRDLTQEDVREITQSAIGFFRLLLEWKNSAGSAASESDVDRDEAASSRKPSRENSGCTLRGGPET